MAVEKLSIALEAELAAAVRAAAEAEGMSVSDWLARTAEARVRQLRARATLEAITSEQGPLCESEIHDLVNAAHRHSRLGRTAS